MARIKPTAGIGRQTLHAFVIADLNFSNTHLEHTNVHNVNQQQTNQIGDSVFAVPYHIVTSNGPKRNANIWKRYEPRQGSWITYHSKREIGM